MEDVRITQRMRTELNISLFCLPHSRREERNGSYG
nr:MAG TPA: hypothetical protein [Bacteriophage sp.]